MDSFTKKTSEVIGFSVDFTDYLTLETIDSYTVNTFLENEDVSSEIITSTTILSGIVYVKVQSGQDGCKYVFKVTITTDQNNIYTKEILMTIYDSSPLDLTKISLESIKHYNNITNNDLDNPILTYLRPSLKMMTTRLNNNFIMKNNSRYVHDSFTINFLENLITLSSDFEVELQPNDVIKIWGTDYNDGFYIVDSYGSKVITVDKTLRTEEVTGYVALCDFPMDVIEGLSKIIFNKIPMDSDRDYTIKSEKMPDYSINYYDKNIKVENINNILNNLSHYRHVYKEVL